MCLGTETVICGFRAFLKCMTLDKTCSCKGIKKKKRRRTFRLSGMTETWTRSFIKSSGVFFYIKHQFRVFEQESPRLTYRSGNIAGLSPNLVVSLLHRALCSHSRGWHLSDPSISGQHGPALQPGQCRLKPCCGVRGVVSAEWTLPCLC